MTSPYIVTSDSDLLVALAKAMIDLFNGLQGKSHGVFQGTQEAVLAEAQGATIGPDGYSHLTDLVATRDMIAKRQDLVTNTLGRLNATNPFVASRIRDLLKPILDWSANVRETLTRTEEMAQQLKLTDGRRLSGVNFGEGGMGPEVGRTTRALVSSQIQRRTAELQGRGIEPRLIPSVRAGAQQLIAKIRDLPIDRDDAVKKLAAVLGTMRAIVGQMIRQAAAAGRVALQAALLTIEEALIALSARFMTLPILFMPDPDQLMKDLFGIDRNMA